ncbi:MAG TPA: hypothetical protein VHD89_08875, partial [Rhodanobacteraceae bacterium]|nr:hypothetical protein [Rhodanobacteraceae bacterium]
MARVHAAAVPLVHASDLRALLDFYCGTLGLRLVQESPGALAVLSLGRARLQIWQREGLKPRHCHIALTAARGGIFRLHACLA